MTSTPTSWDALEQRLAQIKKPVGTFKLCEDPTVRDRYLTAQQTLDRAQDQLAQFPKDATDAEARTLVEKIVKDAQTELAAAKKAYDAKTITLRFTALERVELAELQRKHPPTEEDEENGEEFAVDTFAPVLISAASLDGMPADKARQYLDTWPPTDARDLWNAAWSIQHQKRTDLGKG